MGILSGYGKFKRYVLTDSGYKLCSQWTSSNTVQFDDGNTAQTKLGAISGITDSLTATSSNVALSAKAGKSLQDQVTELNADIATTNIRLKNTALYVAPMSDSKALNIVCSRADYDSMMCFVCIYVGSRIGCILVINGGLGINAATLTDVTLNYGYAKLYENTGLAVKFVHAIKENNNVRVKIQMENVRDDYRAFISPLSATAVSGAAMYSAYWAIS